MHIAHPIAARVYHPIAVTALPAPTEPIFISEDVYLIAQVDIFLIQFLAHVIFALLHVQPVPALFCVSLAYFQPIFLLISNALAVSPLA